MIQAACDPEEKKAEYDLEVNRLLRMVGRVRAIETERHAEAVRVATERELARIAPLVARDAVRRNLRGEEAPKRRRRMAKMADEAIKQGVIAVEDLNQAILTARQIRFRIRDAQAPVVETQQDEIAA